MASEPRLVVEVPSGGAVAAQLQREPPPAEVAVVPLPPGETPEAGQVVMSVLSPEALVRDRDELRRVVDEAGTGEEPLVIEVEAAEELRADELAAVLEVARHAPRSVIVRIAGEA
jgi:hypothetical protein